MFAKNILPTIALLFAINLGFSQTVVFKEKVDTTKPLSTPKKSKNSSIYTHSYFSVGLLFGENGTDVENKFGGRFFTYGYRMKLKVNKAQALVFDLRYAFDRNYFNVNANPFDESMRLISGNATFHDFQGAIGHRFNFDWNRGDDLGTYLDISAFGGFNAGSTLRVISSQATDSDIRITSVYNRIPMESRVYYGFEARLGYKKYALYARMASEFASWASDNNSLGWTQFYGYHSQPLAIGLELSF